MTYIKLLRYYDLSQKFWYLLHLTLNSYDKYGRCRCISVQVTMQGGCACRFEYPGDSCSASLFLSFSLPVFCSTPLVIAYNFFNCLLSLERSLTLFQPSIQSHARSLCSFYSLMLFIFSEYFSPEIINSLNCSIFSTFRYINSVKHLWIELWRQNPKKKFYANYQAGFLNKKFD